MNEQLDDEITSINAIYSDNSLEPLSAEEALYSLVLPGNDHHISLRLHFPSTYPDEKPVIVGTRSLGDSLPKGIGQDIVNLARHVLDQIFIPGSPCVFDLVEDLSAKLSHILPDTAESPDQTLQAAHINGQDCSSDAKLSAPDDHQSYAPPSAAPDWVLSDAVTEKKSVFIARLVRVESVDDAKASLYHLVTTDKRVARATHNITAWRIRGQGNAVFQDCDDDGETAAGGRLLHLLQLMDVWDVMVCVTRWYGGVHLGPDRFRIINSVARDAVTKAGLGKDAGKSEGGKKGGKR